MTKPKGRDWRLLGNASLVVKRHQLGGVTVTNMSIQQCSSDYGDIQLSLLNWKRIINRICSYLQMHWPIFLCKVYFVAEKKINPTSLTYFLLILEPGDFWLLVVYVSSQPHYEDLLCCVCKDRSSMERNGSHTQNQETRLVYNRKERLLFWWGLLFSFPQLST